MNINKKIQAKHKFKDKFMHSNKYEYNHVLKYKYKN